MKTSNETRVSEAVSQLLLEVCDAAGDCAAETIPVVVGCLTELAQKGIDPEDEESYYSDEEDHGEVDPAVAAKGLGQVGNVPIQDTLWSRCVPGDLRSRYQKWRDISGGVGSSDGVGVREMLDALVRDGALSRRTSVREASGKAQVRPKSSEKCAFILNCVKQNACDSRKPRGFQQPQMEIRGTPFCWGGDRSYIWQNWICPTFFGVCAYQRAWSVNSVCAWDTPSMCGSRCRLGGSIHPSCARNWYTVSSKSPFDGYLCCFLSTRSILLLVGTRRFVGKAVRRAKHRLKCGRLYY